ncbi:hypothetical protein [Sorangium sp. So ce1000]|uniref:hypothetical protein n=1 Tax=Sorangium sp. So ce1000 TaxID=3133325 RepID=UPI003F60AE48
MGGDATAPEGGELEICFISIVCAAPLVDAVQHGIFEEHGLRVNGTGRASRGGEARSPSL